MKSILTVLGLLLLWVPSYSTEITAITPHSRYGYYTGTPKASGSHSFGSDGNTPLAIGDTANDTPDRVGLLLAFGTNDTTRAALNTSGVTISLRIKISSIENGGASGPIIVALLDGARDMTQPAATGLAWLQAPNLNTLTATFSPSAVGVEQIIDVTSILLPHISRLDWQKSGIVFGLYVPVPSDNETRNLSFMPIQEGKLIISQGITPMPSVEIGNAIHLDVSTVQGKIYFIEYSTDLVTWIRESDGIVGTGSVKRLFYPLTASRQFYRVVVAQ